jgi:hypothetical protein
VGLLLLLKCVTGGLECLLYKGVKNGIGTFSKHFVKSGALFGNSVYIIFF